MLTEEQKVAIREAVKGIHRTRLSLVVNTNEDHSEGILSIVQDADDDNLLVKVGSVHNGEELFSLCDAVGLYLDQLYSMGVS